MITDVAGRTIRNLQSNVTTGETILSTDVSMLSNGTYIVRLVAADGSVVSEKFIIMKDQ
jgi:hypothetical protein